MRHIPPDVWKLAVLLGTTQRLFDETQNDSLKKSCNGMAQMIDNFLESTRKDVKK